MDTRTWAGIISGLIYGVAIFWGAVYQSIAAGGWVTLAAGAIGLAGGSIGGALLYLIVAVCPVLQRTEAELPELGEEYRAAA